MKIKFVLTILLLSLCLTACGEAVGDKLTTESENTPSQDETTNAVDLFDLVYGCYECNDTYIRLTKDSFEMKDKKSGALIYSSTVKEVTVKKTDDGTVEYRVVFDGDSHEPITIYYTSNGIFQDSESEIYSKISDNDYDSIMLVPAETSDEIGDNTTMPDTDTDDSGDNITNDDSYSDDEYYEDPGIPWYEYEFLTYTVYDDLYTINNLLAVGDIAEAEAMIEEKIFTNIETRVQKYISERKYFLAQNYVCMYQAYIGIHYYSYGCNYPFLKNYFDNKYPSHGIYKPTQKYFTMIYQAVIKDQEYLSKDESMYLLNRILIENGQNPVTGLFTRTNYYAYFYDLVGADTNTYGFIIVDPYTQEVYDLPISYSFFEDGVIYDSSLYN